MTDEEKHFYDEATKALDGKRDLSCGLIAALLNCIDRLSRLES